MGKKEDVIIPLSYSSSPPPPPHLPPLPPQFLLL